jgi:hypothetical protein
MGFVQMDPYFLGNGSNTYFPLIDSWSMLSCDRYETRAILSHLFQELWGVKGFPLVTASVASRATRQIVFVCYETAEQNGSLFYTHLHVFYTT